jgi:hypothetical protein
MATRTLLTIEQYAALDEPVGVRYELSAGDLIVTPSASFFNLPTVTLRANSIRRFAAPRPVTGSKNPNC